MISRQLLLSKLFPEPVSGQWTDLSPWLTDLARRLAAAVASSRISLFGFGGLSAFRRIPPLILKHVFAGPRCPKGDRPWA